MSASLHEKTRMGMTDVWQVCRTVFWTIVYFPPIMDDEDEYLLICM